MHARNRISLFLLSLTVAVANAAWAHPEYRVTVVGPPGSAPTDINNDGVVVGTFPVSATATRGFLNRGSGIVVLGTLGGKSSDAQAINDQGEVLGNWITSAGQQRGYVYRYGQRGHVYRYGRQRDIGVIPGRPTTFIDINNNGYILALGGSTDPLQPSTRSFLRAPDGKYRDIGNLPFENPITQAEALSNRNKITGQSGPLLLPDPPLRAFIWARGVMRDLGDFGSVPNNGQAINDSGQVTGFASVPVGIHSRVAFLYSNGRLINIDGRPDSVVDRFSTGEGINNHGHVVGASDHLAGFIYRGKRMQSLNALIDPKLGWDIQLPRAINDAGQIAAIAYRKGVQYAVRLDLIRPSALAAPALEPDDDQN